MQICRHLPWQTSWQKKASLYSCCRGGGTLWRENILNCRHYQFLFCHPPDFVILSSICFCEVLCMWTYQRRQHPWARLCHTSWVSLKTPAASHPNISKTSVLSIFEFRLKCLLCMLDLLRDRCLCNVEHQQHTGVLIRHTNNSVGGCCDWRMKLPQRLAHTENILTLTGHLRLCAPEWLSRRFRDRSVCVD